MFEASQVERRGPALRDLGRVARQPEVGDSNRAVPPDHHVLGLEVAMHQPGLVGGQQPLARGGEHLADLPPRSRRGGQPGGQRLTLDELHRQVDARAVGLIVDRARVVHDHDVRMREASYRLRFAQQSFLGGVRRRPRARRLTEELEGDLPIEARIESSVNLSHPAPSNQAKDEVATHTGTADEPPFVREGVSQRPSRQRLRGTTGAGSNQVGTGGASCQVALDV